MLDIAKRKGLNHKNVVFISGFSDQTGLPDDFADIVTCSQSFHWMDPETTLKEVFRILKNGGVFAAYDCDWPPVCSWKAEKEYEYLFEKVKEIESSGPEIGNSYRMRP